MPLKSVISEVSSPVVFKNLTDKNVLLYWIDFSGSCVFYGILKPCTRKDNGLEVDTFVSHPWVAIERGSKNLLKLNWKHVFMPPNPAEWSTELKKRIEEYFPVYDKPKLNSRENGLFHAYRDIKMAQEKKSNKDTSKPTDSTDNSEAPLIEQHVSTNNVNQTHDDGHLTSIIDLKYEVVVTDSVLRLETLCQQKLCENVHHELHCQLPLSKQQQKQLQDTLEKWFY